MKARVMFPALVCWIALLLSPANAAPGAELGWQPARTWLFVVGVLEWKDSESFGSFPQKERRDAEMVALFKEKGVPAAQIVYLQDRQATQSRIDAAFAAHLQRMKPGDLLVLYYAGHGYQSEKGKDVYLAPYDAGSGGVKGWAVKAIPRTIEKFAPAAQVLWLIDCCQSGSAVLEVKQRSNGPSYACVTSSLASQSSTGHWTFTEAFLDALRGTAYVDLNRDGRVTIAEFALHVEQDMTLAEEQQSAFTTTGSFDPQMVLATAPPLAHPRVGERVQVKSEGEWYTARVVEVKGEEFKVHYIGYGADEDVWVKAAMMKPITPKQYPVGTNVDVLWKKVWYPAKVLEVKGGVHFIHYDDYGDEWDEWVSSKRIRPRKH